MSEIVAIISGDDITVELSTLSPMSADVTNPAIIVNIVEGGITVDNSTSVTTAQVQAALAAASNPTSMGDERVTNVGAPTDPTDAATKAYVDAGDADVLDEAQTYADNADAAVLSAAEAYADALSASTTGAVTLTVNAATGDDSDPARPTIITAGNYSANPFETVQAALDAVPRVLGGRLKVLVAAGEYAGFLAQGFVGKGDLEFIGAFVAATLTTGVASGTAGSGTTSTQMNKPAAVANWTSADLRGHLLVITAGGGASETDVPTVRAIKSNTTTALIVDTLPGMDDTSVFEIVDPGVVVESTASPPIAGMVMCASFIGNEAVVSVVGIKPDQLGADYGIYSERNRRIEFHGWAAAQDASVAIVYSQDDHVVKMNDAALSGGANVLLVGATTADASHLTADDGALALDQCANVSAQLDADTCLATALSVTRANNAVIGLNANGCAVTPLVLESVTRCDIGAGGLTGTGNTGYGADISRGGTYDLAGASLTGSSGDFRVDGSADTWANLASFGAVSRWSGTLVVNA